MSHQIGRGGTIADVDAGDEGAIVKCLKIHGCHVLRDGQSPLQFHAGKRGLPDAGQVCGQKCSSEGGCVKQEVVVKCVISNFGYFIGVGGRAVAVVQGVGSSVHQRNRGECPPRHG